MAQKYKKRPPTVWERLPVVLDCEDIAILFGISVSQARRLAREGKIPAFPVGNRWRFEKSKIMAFVGVEEGVKQC